MKKIFTGALILAISIGAAQAQTTRGKHEGQKKEYGMAYDQLDLSADQKSSVKKINEDFKKKMDDLKKQDQLTVAEMKQRRQEIQDQHKSQIEAILTPAQKDQVAKMKTNRGTMNKDGNGRFNKNDDKRADLQKDLNLSEEQQEKVSQIRSSYRTKMQTLRNDSSITQDQKKTKMQALMKQQQEELRSVLTKEQFEKMKSMRQDMRQEQRARNTK